MLTDADIELMRNTRREIVDKRQTQITLEYPGEGTIDKISGEALEGVPVTRNVMSVVTELSSATGAGANRYLIAGVEIEKGDLWFSVGIDLIVDIYDKATLVRYGNKPYVILAADRKGIGAINRVEYLARRES